MKNFNLASTRVMPALQSATAALCHEWGKMLEAWRVPNTSKSHNYEMNVLIVAISMKLTCGNSPANDKRSIFSAKWPNDNEVKRVPCTYDNKSPVSGGSRQA